MLAKLLRLFSYTPLENFAVIVSLIYLIRAERYIKRRSSADIIHLLSTSPQKSERVKALDPLHRLKRTRLVSFTEAVDRNWIWKPSCLRRTTALTLLFRALGFFPNFKIGVHSESGVMKAHSWLELDGIRLEIDDEAESYHTLTKPAES